MCWVFKQPSEDDLPRLALVMVTLAVKLFGNTLFCRRGKGIAPGRVSYTT
jgi:hypothetical protein